MAGFKGDDTVIRLALPNADTMEEARQTVSAAVQHLCREHPEMAYNDEVTQSKRGMIDDTALGKFRQHAGTLANASWIAGNLIWLHSAFNQKNKQGELLLKEDGSRKINWLDAGIASTFALSNTAVALNVSRKPRDGEALIADIDTYLKTEHDRPLTREEAQEAQSSFQKISELYKRYPWELAAVFNAAVYTVSTVGNLKKFLFDDLGPDFAEHDPENKLSPEEREKQRQQEKHAALIQGIGAFGGLSGALSQLLIPQKNGDRFVDPEELMEEYGEHPALQPLVEAGEKYPAVKEMGSSFESMLQRASQHRMPINATLSTLDNLGVQIAGWVSPTAGATKSLSQYFSYGGYVLQGIAHGLKRMEPEEALFSAAVYLDKVVREEPPEVLEETARRLSQEVATYLQMQHDITDNWKGDPAEKLYRTWQELANRREEAAAIAGSA